MTLSVLRQSFRFTTPQVPGGSAFFVRHPGTTPKNMKTKQLANVLIKILGLSVLVHSIPGIGSGVFFFTRARGVSSSGDGWLYALTTVIVPVIGIIFIVKSRDIATFLFKNEDE